MKSELQPATGEDAAKVEWSYIDQNRCRWRDHCRALGSAYKPHGESR
jgi:hypothetical protein